jgi:hypothetical protein
MVCVSAGRAGGRLLVVVVGALGLSAFAFSPVAAAVCQSGAHTYGFVNSEQCYTVAPGVGELSVTAVGGEGFTITAPGGFGAVVGGEIAVAAGETLFVEVGSNVIYATGHANRKGNRTKIAAREDGVGKCDAGREL